MVLVDGVKYACQACIKGHRSSKCTHTDRELTEIKKKGRPTSQCNHCRDLRKTRSVHGKCECVSAKDSKEPRQAAKVLPNGLIDIIQRNEPAELNSKTAKSRVNLLLNPCTCRTGGKCSCCQIVSKAKVKPFPETPPSPMFISTDLPLPIPHKPVAAQATGRCCSPKRASPIAPETIAPSSSRCSTRPSSAQASGSDPSRLDIPVPDRLDPPLAYNYSSSDPLFLPQTHGTLSCFCGPTCQCVGCATHDPFALKAKRKRSNTLEAVEGPIGCQCETRPGESDVESTRQGKKKKECCGSQASSATRPNLQDLAIDWPELNLPSESGPASRGGTDTPPTTNSLPSLRTLLPALIDSAPESLQPLFGRTFDPPNPSGDSDGLEPGSASAEDQPKIACASAYIHEVFDDSGDCGPRCMCDTDCGCRLEEVGGNGEVSADDGPSKPVQPLEDIARLASMGYFG